MKAAEILPCVLEVTSGRSALACTALEYLFAQSLLITFHLVSAKGAQWGIADIALARSSRTSVAEPAMWQIGKFGLFHLNPQVSEIHSPPHKLRHQAWVVMARASLCQHIFHQEVFEGEATCAQRGHFSRGSLNSLMDTQKGIFWDPVSLGLGYSYQHSRKVPCPTPGGGIYWFLSETWLFSLQWMQLLCSYTCQQLCLPPLLVCKSSPLRKSRGTSSLNPQRYPSIRELCPSASCFNPPKSWDSFKVFLITGPIMAVCSGSPFPHNHLKLRAVTQCDLLPPS